MKIKISTGDYPQYVEFPITGIHFSLDENNHPIDIVIYGQENILTDIGKFAEIGFNMQPLDSWDYMMEALGATHGCLCARLPMFEVIGASECTYK